MAERGSAEGTSGRRGGRGLAGFLAVFEAIALAVQLQDVDVVGQSIEQPPVSRSDPKISVHSLKGRFEVTSVDACS